MRRIVYWIVRTVITVLSVFIMPGMLDVFGYRGPHYSTIWFIGCLITTGWWAYDYNVYHRRKS